MNYEQVLRLPVTREDFLVKPFSQKKLVYAIGLGLFGYQLMKGKEISLPDGGPTFHGDDYSRVMFVSLPSENDFQKKVRIDPQLEIVRFDFREAMQKYLPNTGLTVAKDKNRLVTLLLNYRKESNGDEKLSLIGLNEKFLEKNIKNIPAYCTVSVDNITGIVEILTV